MGLFRSRPTFHVSGRSEAPHTTPRGVNRGCRYGYPCRSNPGADTPSHPKDTPLDDTDTIEHHPLTDIAAEREFIGGTIRVPGTLATTIRTMNDPGMFTEPLGECAWQCVMELFATSKPITVSTVRAAMITKPGMNATTVSGWLATLHAEAPLLGDQVLDTATRVEDLHRRRIADVQLRSAAAANLRADGTAEHTLTAIESALTELRTGIATADQVVAGFDALESALELLTARSEGNVPIGITTGSADLDKALDGGFEAGRVYANGGRPGSGKTIFGVDCARAALRSGTGVIFVTLEMPPDEIFNRILSAEAQLDSRLFRSGKLDSDQWAKVATASTGLPWDNLIFIDRPGITIEVMSALVAQSSNQLRAAGVKDILVVVDYLQIMGFDGPSNASRQQVLGVISREMKNMARTAQVAVLMLCQLGRGVDTRPPTMSDLRESGDIEANADSVILLYNPSSVDPEDRPGEVDFILAKNRGGQAGVIVDRVSRFRYSSFTDRAHTTGDW